MVDEDYLIHGTEGDDDGNPEGQYMPHESRVYNIEMRPATAGTVPSLVLKRFCRFIDRIRRARILGFGCERL